MPWRRDATAQFAPDPSQPPELKVQQHGRLEVPSETEISGAATNSAILAYVTVSEQEPEAVRRAIQAD